MSFLPIILRVFAVLTSGALLYVAFPPVGDVHSAWLAFMPLLILARYTTPRKVFKWGYISGLVFWLPSISWLLRLGQTGTNIYLAALGWVLLSAYAAIYTGLFSVAASILLRHEDELMKRENNAIPVALWRVQLVFLIPAAWVGVEYIRAVLLGGFPWNQLGVSQYSNLSIIQIAAWGGVYMVSAVVMVMNVALTLTGLRLANVYMRKGKSSRFRYELMVGLLICALCWMTGTRKLMKNSLETEGMTEVRIAAVQPNTVQIKKWDLGYEIDIFSRLLKQTRLAAINGPHLIVWPETAVMRPYNMDDVTQEFVRELTALGTPILVGAMEKEHVANSEDVYNNWRFYNSSFLVGVDGETQGKYRKQHLVPFGECIPLETKFEFIKRIAPLGFSCTPGAESTLMEVKVGGDPVVNVPFSVLICFEDIFSGLSRKAVKEGAEFLVNQTNDAWFDGTAASVQHMSHCVFRAVENGVPIVRSANTGVTCFINKIGVVNVLAGLDNKYGVAVEGFKVSGIMVSDAEKGRTLYNRCGDMIFAIPCAMLVLGLFAFAGCRTYNKQRKNNHDR